MGYETALSTANGFLTSQYNNAQGYRNILSASPDFRSENLASLGQNHLVNHRKAQPDVPWMLHLHFMEPHVPYVAPDTYYEAMGGLPKVPEWIAKQFDEPLEDAFDIENANHYAVTNDWSKLTEAEQAQLREYLLFRYRADIRWLDDQFASWWGAYDKAGLLDDTLVLVWSDHGEQFWERTLQGHAHFLAAEETDAIAFFWAKNLVPRVVSYPTHAVDLLPTTLLALQVPFSPNSDRFSGRIIDESVPPVSRFSSTRGRRPARAWQSVTSSDGLKLMYRLNNGDIRMFDRSVDPAELDNIYNLEHPESRNSSTRCCLGSVSSQRLKA